MSELPLGWAQVTTDALFTFVTSGSRGWARYYTDEGAPFFQVGNLRRASITPDLVDIRRVNPPEGAEGVRTQVESDDILISITADLGRVALMTDIKEASYINQHVALARPVKAINSRYLAWYLSSDAVQRRWVDKQRGVTKLGLGLGDIRSVEVPIPPYAEQERIVAAIEENFSRLDAGVAALERARQNLKRMRDLLPLLLLGRDRGAAPDEDSEFGSRHVDGNSYQWAQLADVSEQIVDCPHSTPIFLSQGMACIDTTCISPGVIHRDRLRYVDTSTYRDRVRRLMPQHGDLIFAREGTVGTAVVVPRDMHPCLGQRVMLFRPDPSAVDSDYMCLVVNSEIVKRQYRSMLLGTTVPHLNVRDAKVLRIPLPSLQVQRTIVTEADQIGSVLSAVDTAIELNETLSSSLRSSILTAAFSGKLVPQDSDDEAASVLLEQIATERASSNSRKPASSRKPRTPCERVVI